MHYPQLLVYESDGLLARMMRPLAESKNWFVREPRRLESCLRLLRGAHPGVLVVKVGKDVVRELTIVERVHWRCPDTPAVVVGDADHAPLASLAWHLGASYVLLPPQPRELLSEVVTALMEAALEQRRPTSEKAVPEGTTGAKADDHD